MISAIKGAKDILPAESGKWRRLEAVVRERFRRANYGEIRTPVFEETALFKRGVGESADIVRKEMYAFEDMSGTSIALKPEMTAPVVRAFIEHKLGKAQPLVKAYYIAPMFRQERPQAGRQRQFHQFGSEALGSDAVALDVETIQLAYDLLRDLGLTKLDVKINSLGKPADRATFVGELRAYLQDKQADLSEDSRRRLDVNALRVLDSKDERDQKLLDGAPKLADFLDDESRERFAEVRETLDAVGVPYLVEERLVRGLDYYTETTFEIQSPSVGSQSALCGGGRYDNLVELLGGDPTPGVGFAAGVERILLALENESVAEEGVDPIDAYVVSLEKNPRVAYPLAVELRRAGFVVEFDYLGRSVKAQMREANRLEAKRVIFLGGEEAERGEVSIKDMSDGGQTTAPRESIVNHLRETRSA